MAKYNIYWNAQTRQCQVLHEDRPAPGGDFNKIGEHHHGDVDDEFGYPGNHVLIHHLRDVFYKIGETNLQTMSITKTDSLGIQVLLFSGSHSVSESASPGFTIGSLSVQNPRGESYVFSELVDNDNVVTISGANVNLSRTLDYETKTSHDITLQGVTDGQTPVSGVFTIDVVNALEGTLGPNTANMNSTDAAGTLVFTATGMDAGATEVIQSISPNDGRFAIAGNTIVKGSSAVTAGVVPVTYTTSAGRSKTVNVTVLAAIPEVHPFDYATHPTIGVSMRKLDATITAKCCNVRGNTVTTASDIDWSGSARDSLVSDSGLAAVISAGNTEIRDQTWYNQFGTPDLVATSQSTGLRAVQAANGVGGKPAMKSTANAQGLTSNKVDGTGPFNVGGAGDKFCFIAAISINGYGSVSFGTATPSSVSTANGTILGLGSTSGEEILSATETDNFVSSEPVYGGIAALRDDVNMLFERSTTFGRRRVIALTIDGNKFTGFIGQEKVFEYVATSFAEKDAVRMWLGSASGPTNTANVEYNEVFVWANHIPSDVNILGIMKNMKSFWGITEDKVETLDFNIAMMSQSNGGWFETDGWPAFHTIVQAQFPNAAIHKVPTAFNTYTSFGGSAVQKACAATSAPTNYWREPDRTSGPNAITAKTALAAAGHKARRTFGLIIIGEQESVGLQLGASTFNGSVGDPLYNTATKTGYKNGILDTAADFEASLGHTIEKWIIVSLHRQDGYDAGYELTRQAQIELSEADSRFIYLSASLDASLRDIVHWDATSLSNKIAPRVANAIMKLVKPSLVKNVIGPSITDFQFTNGTQDTVRFTLVHPANGGNDWGPADGNLAAMDVAGFRVEADGVQKTVASIEYVDGTHGLLHFAAPITGTVIRAKYIDGTSYNPAKVLVDNATRNFPVQAGRFLPVRAAS